MLIFRFDDGYAENSSLGIQKGKRRVLLKLKVLNINVLFVEVYRPAEHAIFSCVSGLLYLCGGGISSAPGILL
jgi:hypothetical protein